jgi:type II secretory pathway pseudopilin PulG
MSDNKFFNKENGITLIEIVVSISIIAMFSLIVLADFPKIKRQFALSRAVYKLSQNIRRIEDFGLSGVQLFDNAGNPVPAKGYGIYVDLNSPKQYIIYADTCPETRDKKYTPSDIYCPAGDYKIETIDVGKEESGVSIIEIDDPYDNLKSSASINFVPPNPTINITEDTTGDESSVEFVMGMDVDTGQTRRVFVNTSGLIEVK